MPEENKKMFNDIAAGYDKTNDFITLGRHKSWYRLMVKISQMKPGSSMLDCATGTGNIAIEFKSIYKDKLNVTGIDVAANMLDIAREKTVKAGLKINFMQGDILNLPFSDNEFNVATISFGIRNTESIENCLTEMSRVVKPGGQVMILETGRMTGIKKRLFWLYQKTFVRILGSALTGNSAAYDYFIESSNEFPSGLEFINIMKNTDRYSHIDYRKKMFGTIFLYIGDVK